MKASFKTVFIFVKGGLVWMVRAAGMDNNKIQRDVRGGRRR